MEWRNKMVKRKRYFAQLFLLIMTCILMTGCQSEEKAETETTVVDIENTEDKEMVVAVNVDGSSSELPFESVWMNRSKFWGGLIFQGLLIADDNISNVNPDLCEEYIISPDGKKYVFILKDNVYWHDGQKLTAEDVVWSIETSTITPQMNGYIQKGIKSIKGVAEYQEGKADSISGISVEGNAITIELLEKDGQFLASIAQLAILPKHCLCSISP